jgi:hypothetical protein
MGVDLRIVGPGGRLAERGHREPDGVGVEPAAAAPDAGGGALALQVLQGGGHRDVVRFEHPGIARQRPPHDE